MKTIGKLIGIALLVAGVAAPTFAETPSDSLYRLDLTLVDQDAHAFRLSDRAGKPQLVSMFYTSCQYTCPLIVEAMKKNQSTLTADERARLPMLLVSFDAKRDTPERLKQVAAQRKTESPTWTLAHAEPQDVRKLAAALDIPYRELAGGDFSHASTLVLLSSDGRILARTTALGDLDTQFVAALHAALAHPD